MGGVYQRIGKGYNKTRRADPYLASRISFHLQIRNDARYLDVACGTGNYAHAMAAIGGAWHGVDESATMIDQAHQVSRDVDVVIGKAERLPYMGSMFGGAICTLAIHHFEALDPALGEIHRVIKQGRLVLFTTTPEQTRRYWLAEYFPEAISKSADQLPALDTITQGLTRSGLELVATEPYSVRDDLQDLFLYSGKWRPEIYLEPEVRAGISTFALHCLPSELEAGCERLAADIESGAVREVIDRHLNAEGDYLFVVAEKN